MFDRRNFLASLAGIAGGLTLPQRLLAELAQAPGKLPDASLYEANEEAYWVELRKQFLIPEDEVYLNNGTVGSSPAPVVLAR